MSPIRTDRRRFIRGALALSPGGHPPARPLSWSALSLSAIAAPGLSLSAPSGAADAARLPETARLVCGFPPGGISDLISRIVAERLTGRIATTVTVENKPGAAGRLAVEEVRRGAADGSTMLLTPASVMTIYPHVYRQLTYDPLVDLAPVTTVASTAFALAIGPRVPASVGDLWQFVTWCRAHPELADCGNAGTGSFQHLLAAVAAEELDIPLTHVPFKGGPAAMQAAAAGDIAAAMTPENSPRALSASGRLRVIATTNRERSRLFPDAPSFVESGRTRLVQREWFGVFMPRQVAPGRIQETARWLREAVAAPTLLAAWDRAGLAPEAMTPAQLATAMRAETAFWQPVVKALGFTPEV